MVFKLSMYSIYKFKGTSKDRPFQLFRCEVVEHVPFTKPFGLLHGSTVPSDAIKSQGCVACTALRTPHSPFLKLRRNVQLRQSSPLNTRTDPSWSSLIRVDPRTDPSEGTNRILRLVLPGHYNAPQHNDAFRDAEAKEPMSKIPKRDS